MEEELSLDIPEEEVVTLPQPKVKKTPTYYEDTDSYGAFDSGSPFASPSASAGDDGLAKS